MRANSSCLTAILVMIATGGIFISGVINNVSLFTLDGNIADDVQFWLVISGVVFAMVAGLGIWRAFQKWDQHGRDWRWDLPANLNNNQHAQKRQLGVGETVVTEFSPPNNLPPAMVALLLKDNVSAHDAFVSMLDLARRGYVQAIAKVASYAAITEVNQIYNFERTDKPIEELFEFEKKLLEKYFSSKGSTAIARRNALEYSARRFASREAFRLGFFTRKPLLTKGQEVVKAGLIGLLNLAILFIGATATALSGQLSIVLVGVGLGVAVWAIAYGVAGSNIPQKSAKGYDMYRRVLGFADFVTNARLHQARFIHNQELFETALVYSLIFQSRDEMQKVLEHFSELRTPDWIKARE